MPKHERFTTAVNDSTGDLIKTKASNQQAYADNWERIFGKKDDAHPHNNSGVRYTGAMIPETISAEQALSRLVDDDILTNNVVRRHEEQNSGNGVALFEEEHITVPFTEELLPSGIIGDEV